MYSGLALDWISYYQSSGLEWTQSGVELRYADNSDISQLKFDHGEEPLSTGYQACPKYVLCTSSILNHFVRHPAGSHINV